MADTITAVERRTGCGHLHVTVDIDGRKPLVLAIHESELESEWTPEDERQHAILSLRRLRRRGVPVEEWVGKIAHGEAAETKGDGREEGR